MLPVFEAVYAGKSGSFSRDLMQLGLDAFFTKSPDVVNFVVFLVAHYNLRPSESWAGILSIKQVQFHLKSLKTLAPKMKIQERLVISFIGQWTLKTGFLDSIRPVF